MTTCQIWSCGATFDGADEELQLAQHLEADHPTAVRARKGLEAWRRMMLEDPGATAPVVRGRGQTTKTAYPESPSRVHENASSPGRVSAQAGSRPRQFCVYCGHRTYGATCCSNCGDLDALQ